MMDPLLRPIAILATAPLRGALTATETSVLHLRVRSSDLDINAHMNNGRYLTAMDLGRYDLAARIGIAKRMITDGWQPLLAGVTIRFRRSLSPWQRFELHTRIAGWDAKWLYMEQRFIAKGEIAAQAYVRGLFRNSQGKIPTEVLLSTIGYQGLPLPISETLRAWVAFEQAFDAEDYR